MSENEELTAQNHEKAHIGNIKKSTKIFFQDLISVANKGDISPQNEDDISVRTIEPAEDRKGEIEYYVEGSFCYLNSEEIKKGLGLYFGEGLNVRSIRIWLKPDDEFVCQIRAIADLSLSDHLDSHVGGPDDPPTG